jgi:hypothetical protein
MGLHHRSQPQPDITSKLAMGLATASYSPDKGTFITNAAYEADNSIIEQATGTYNITTAYGVYSSILL